MGRGKYNDPVTDSALDSDSARALGPDGPFAWVESPPGTLVFTRGERRCVVNVDGEPLPLDGPVLLSSEPADGVLPPGAAAWL